MKADEIQKLRDERRLASLVARAWRKYHPQSINKKSSTSAYDYFGFNYDFHEEKYEESYEDDTDDTDDNIPDYVKQQASSSYSTMIENDKLGEICIVEICYVFTGVEVKNLSLLFLALKQLVDSERDEWGGKLKVDRRHKILSAFKHKLKFNLWQSEVKYPNNDLEHISMHKPMFKVDFLDMVYFPEVTIPLPLPQVEQEWGFATLILRLKYDNLVKLLMLLLLENPCLVVGRIEEVSVCTCTLLRLLHPYQWESVFIPNLPGNILDFVESPVPFIAGVVAEDEKEMKLIINDDSVQRALCNGLTVVDLLSGEVHFTKEVESHDVLLMCDNILTMHTFQKMLNYGKRLKYLVAQEDSTLLSFKSFVEYGASPNESIVLKKSLQTINKFMTSLAGDLQASHDSWKIFTKRNNDSDEIEFLTGRLIQPLQDKLHFLEKMVETQLFVSYVNKKIKLDLSTDLSETSLAAKKTIATFVTKYWKEHRHCHRLSSFLND